MQVSTNLFYDRSSRNLSGLSAHADTVQTQISTGKKLAAPSSDSAAYLRLQGLARDSADDTAYAGNLTLAGSVLQQADTTLGAVTDQLQRANVLVIQARSGTQSAVSKHAIGDELAQIVEQLQTLANTHDLRGQPLFGDANGGPAVTSDPNGGFILAATSPSPIPTGDRQGIQVSETAARIFKLGGTDTFAMLGTIAAALQSDTATDAQLGQAITDIGTASDQASLVQSSLGARAARVDLEQTRLTNLATNRESVRSGLEDTDISTAIIDLQKTMTILSATQASFSKLSQLSLFDYLR